MSQKRTQVNNLLLNKSKINKITPFYRQYFVILILAIVAISLNYFYSIAMMLLTTFTLAYFTKGSRCKQTKN